ncbi:MAG: SDR family oxidoreductase [Pseudomonadota bacterium]
MTEIPQTPSFSLAGKRALVTGGTSGIGLGAAAALAQAGAAVTVVARREDKLAEITTALCERGWQATSHALDVANVEQVKEFVVSEAPFEIMVNSAGAARHSAALETCVDDFDAVMAINLRGAYFLTQAVAHRLIENNRPGALMNVSSQMGVVGGVDRAVYCASKHALEGFTKAMAIEWGPHKIRVNTLCPTFIRTPLTQSTFDQAERRAWIEEKIKLGRVGEVEDIMGAVVYLASDAGALVTGTSFLIDGGWTAD